MSKTIKQLELFILREKIIDLIRNFFKQKQFQYINCPVLNHSLPLEPNLYSFKTEWKYLNSKKELYLSCSPEASLKKILALGIKNCFSISPSFRNHEPADLEHNPEFLMLEWYRSSSGYQKIMQDVQELFIYIYDNISNSKKIKNKIVNYQNNKIYLDKKWPIFSFDKLFRKSCNIDFSKNPNLAKLKRIAVKKGYQIQSSTWSEIIDQFFLNDIVPKLPNGPFFLIDFPSKISPLCKKNSKKSYLAERFELYVGKLELANGNNENTDSKQVMRRFNEEQEYRTDNNLTTHPINKNFIQDLNILKGKKIAGAGLGVDRLLMLFTDTISIKQINSFAL